MEISTKGLNRYFTEREKQVFVKYIEYIEDLLGLLWLGPEDGCLSKTVTLVSRSVLTAPHEDPWSTGWCCSSLGHQVWGQDGRVEKPELTLSHKNIKITTTCKTTFSKKIFEPTKNDILLSKTKKKPQWDGRRGSFVKQSNLIPTGWVTHNLEKNLIAEVLPQELVLSPTSGFPTWESEIKRKGFQSIWLWRSVKLGSRNSTGLGK